MEEQERTRRDAQRPIGIADRQVDRCERVLEDSSRSGWAAAIPGALARIGFA